jgi:oligopeptide/dipeptide ABC transporter ATP-binding protein
MALAILGLLARSARPRVEGHVFFQGQDLLTLTPEAMRQIRGGKIALAFQEPKGALNPVLTVGAQVAESLRHHHRLSGQEARRRTLDLFQRLRLPAPAQLYRAYPHQLSGGMQQRIGLAIALSGEPCLLIADEPTSALDLPLQAQVIELLREVRASQKMSLMVITHDINLAAELCERMVVLFAGQVVEQGATKDILSVPAHPYTFASLSALRWLASGQGPRPNAWAIMTGEQRSPAEGCCFSLRCPRACEVCYRQSPALFVHRDRQWVRCHSPMPPNAQDI